MVTNAIATVGCTKGKCLEVSLARGAHGREGGISSSKAALDVEWVSSVEAQFIMIGSSVKLKGSCLEELCINETEPVAPTLWSFTSGNNVLRLPRLGGVR